MKHIFIVDDDIHIGNMLEEVLQREGYKVSRAYSGTEALLVLSTQHSGSHPSRSDASGLKRRRGSA